MVGIKTDRLLYNFYSEGFQGLLFIDKILNNFKKNFALLKIDI